MAIETDVSELREQRRRQTRKNLLIKISAVSAAAVIVLIAVFTRKIWYPYLNGILSKIPSLNDSASADGMLSESGNFPISSAGGSEFQLSPLDGGFALIDDSKFYVYNTDGKCVTEKQHIFTNPILVSSGKKALIYDLGGNSFSLESKYKNIYERTTETPILMAALSDNDVAAVVTKSDKFLAQLDVFSTEGTCIFTYKSSDSRIIGVTFCSDGCIITTLGAKDGEVNSGLIRLSFNSSEPVWESEKASTMAVGTAVDDEGNIVICGDDRCDYFDANGTLLAEHEYGDELVDFDISKKITAVLLENTALRQYGLMIINGNDCSQRIYTDIPEDAKKVTVSGDLVYVLAGSGIYTFNSLGQQISDIRLADSYDNISKIDGYFFLKGYDRVNRISAVG